MINRREEDYIKRKGRPQKYLRNFSSQAHPFQRAKEYTRALKAVKLERMFAKPFVSDLPGSSDTINCLSTIPQSISLLASGDCDGVLSVWNTAKKKVEWKSKAHNGFVSGVSCSDEVIISCGTDSTIKVWSLHSSEQYKRNKSVAELSTLPGTSSFTGIDCQRNSKIFATSSDSVDIWDLDKSKSILNFKWDHTTCRFVGFNKVEKDVLIATYADRGVVLFDTRMKSPTRKMVLRMVSNSASWNPMEPFNFTLANEDHNLYTFDMRIFKKAKTVHEDHLNAVMSVDFSPDGQEFVTGSYDKTVRIFGAPSPRSRDVYHTKRMQRVFVTKFSTDGRFIFSGSDDANIRIWKTQSSEKLGTLNDRETNYMNYCDKLKEKFSFMPEVRKIAKHRHLPKKMYKEKKQKIEMAEARKRREMKIQANSKKERKKPDKRAQSIVGVLE